MRIAYLGSGDYFSNLEKKILDNSTEMIDWISIDLKKIDDLMAGEIDLFLIDQNQYNECLTQKLYRYKEVNSHRLVLVCLLYQGTRKIMDPIVNFYYPKLNESEEINQVAQDLLSSIRSDLKLTGYTKATVSAPVVTILKGNIRALNKKEIVFESNFLPKTSQTLRVEGKILKNLNLTGEVVVTKSGRSGLSAEQPYLLKGSVSLVSLKDMDYLKKQVSLRSVNKKMGEMDKKTYASLLSKEANELYQSRLKKYNNWIKKYSSYYIKDNRQRVLIIDSNCINFDFINKKLNQDFIVRRQNLVVENNLWLDNFNPRYVFFNLEYIKNGQLNDEESILALHRIYNNVKDKDCTLVVFSSNLTYEEVAEHIKSHDFIFSDQDMSITKVQEYLEHFKKNIAKVDPGEEQIQNIYFPKDDTLSEVCVHLPLRLEDISENQAGIVSKEVLPSFCVIETFFVVPLKLMIVPGKEYKFHSPGADNYYRAIIVGMSEEDRKILRAFVITYVENSSSVSPPVGILV